MASSVEWAPSAVVVSGTSPHSGVLSIVGITPCSMEIARRLIFWNLLTLQKSVMQTVKSENEPLTTMDVKCSLLSLDTISKAEVTTRSDFSMHITRGRLDAGFDITNKV